MKRNSLSSTGLSMSDAQSISNLCYQRSLFIKDSLQSVKVASKSIMIDGAPYVMVESNRLPNNVAELLLEIGKLHACQAFLRENIQAKSSLINNIKSSKPDFSSIEEPEYPDLESYTPLEKVNTNWGFEQLSISELNEFYEAQANASHIGQFIHKDSYLDNLRKDLNNLSTIEWKELKAGEKTPVIITPNHTKKELQDLHEELSRLHKKHEARNNYFLAKVENLVTLENSRIAKVNAENQLIINNNNNELMLDYNKKMRDYTASCTKIQNQFEIDRQAKIKEAAALRILVDPRFQSTIDTFITSV